MTYSKLEAKRMLNKMERSYTYIYAKLIISLQHLVWTINQMML